MTIAVARGLLIKEGLSLDSIRIIIKKIIIAIIGGETTLTAEKGSPAKAVFILSRTLVITFIGIPI